MRDSIYRLKFVDQLRELSRHDSSAKDLVLDRTVKIESLENDELEAMCPHEGIPYIGGRKSFVDEVKNYRIVGVFNDNEIQFTRVLAC